MKNVRWVLMGFVIILMIGSLFVFKTVWESGAFKKIVPIRECACTQVHGAVGAEDIAVDRDTGIAYISSSDRRAAMRGEHAAGAIYSYSLKSEKPVLKNLTAGFKKDFHPHGIYLYSKGRGTKLLFVVNHVRDTRSNGAANGERVEIFRIMGNGLRHIETLSDPLITSPNDICAVGPRSFYISNDHGSKTAFQKKIEDYLQRPLSYIVYYDGRSFRKAANKLSYVNGLALSRDGKTLYAAATVDRMIRVFDRDAATGDLKRRVDIFLNTGVDNLDVDSKGDIWVGCHPKLLAFMKHSKDPESLSPSQVLRIIPGGNDTYDMKQVYLDTGEEISGSSVAVRFRRRLLIGSVFGPHFLDCTLKK